MKKTASAATRQAGRLRYVSQASRLQQYLRMLALFLLCLMPLAQAGTLLVLAAASTTDAMKEAGALFAEQTGHTVRFSFASSGALARQIQSGVPADLFVSASTRWMDELRADVEPPVTLFKNRLVLVVPGGRSLGEINRLAVGDIHSVPVGIYAAEALRSTGQFDALCPKMVMAANARAALMFVERGEVDAGIVYATDAKISDRVEVVSIFLAESHSPIRYPAAVCRASKNPELARAFLAFLQSGEAGAVFENYGFVVGQGCRSLQSLPRNNEASLSLFESLCPESLCCSRNQEDTRSRIREACPKLTRSGE